MIGRILLTLRNQSLQSQLKKLLSDPDTIVDTLKSPSKLWDRIGNETSDMVVVSQSFLSSIHIKKIESFKGSHINPAVVILADREDPEERARLLTAGCEAVLYARLPAVDLSSAIRTILEKRLETNQQRLQKEREPHLPRLSDFVSKSAAMERFIQLAHKVVAKDASLLILGETGVGKERLARAIHLEGPRKNGAFVAINCGALPETLLESELFGHEEGSFTGATRARRGCFELAHRGTIFLDEIGEMPHHLQVRLLRVLQEKEIMRVGGEWPIRVDARVMAATSRDIDQLVSDDRFRSDLLYRLSVVRLNVPPLRERKQDIPELVASYIRHFANSTGVDVSDISHEAIQALLSYDWPGNVRELVNVIERATLLATGRKIVIDDLPDEFRKANPTCQSTKYVIDVEGEVSFPQSWLDQPMHIGRENLYTHFEKTYLSLLLQSNQGRIDKTARMAGITPRTLFEKMKRYDLHKEDFRSKVSVQGGNTPLNKVK